MADELEDDDRSLDQEDVNPRLRIASPNPQPLASPEAASLPIRARIAPPNSPMANNLPPVTARGLGPVTASQPGSTEDLESRGLASHLAPRPIAPPSPLESRATADQAELGRLQSTGSGISQLQHGSPTGGANIAKPHPVLGGILRGLDIAGSIAAPLIMAQLPGTELHHQELLGQQQGRIGQDEKQEAADANLGKTQADTEEAEERADLARAQAEEARNPKAKEKPAGQTVTTDQGIFQWNPDTEHYDIRVGAAPVKPQPGETQEQNKLGFQTVIGKLDAAGLATDPKSLDKSLDTAKKNDVITAAEHATARSYESANPTPATNLTVHVAGQEEGAQLAINKLFEGKEVIAHMPDGRRVQMSYAEAKVQGIPPERLVALSSKEAQDNRDKQASTDATFQSLNNYRKDFKGAQLTDTDRDAMRVLASHAQDGTTAGILGGLIEDIPLAGPMTSYANKLLNGTMTSDQYNQLSPAGKKLVSDYFTAVIANFANMKNIMGSVGRNPMQLQAELNTIPLPFLDWESANDAFENKRVDLQRRAASQPELYRPSK